MALSIRAHGVYSRIETKSPKLGDLRKIAKSIKKDHKLALELWSTEEFYPRLLAVLIMDKKMISQNFVDTLANDIQKHDSKERNQLTDWLLANLLAKDKRGLSLMESWEENDIPCLRRIFWFQQGRLRWTGKEPPNNTDALLDSVEKNLENEEAEVQWMMNFAAAQIGIHQPEYRDRCIDLGQKFALYVDEPVRKGCTPAYLPEWIRIEVEKLKK